MKWHLGSYIIYYYSSIIELADIFNYTVVFVCSLLFNFVFVLVRAWECCDECDIAPCFMHAASV